MTAQPLPPGHIRRQVDITIGGEHVGTLDVAPGSVTLFTDRTDATDAEFEARLGRLNRREVADESAVERVARAMHEHDRHCRQPWPCFAEWSYRSLSHAAITALKPPPPDGGDVR